MKRISQLAFVVSVLSSSLAMAMPSVRFNGLNKPETAATVRMAEMLSESLQRPLTNDEYNQIADQVYKIEAMRSAHEESSALVKTRIDSSAGEEQNVTTWYACIGGRLSVFIVGVQMMRCLNTDTGKTANVFFSTEDFLKPLSGLIAKDYFGISAGASVNLGVMVVHGPKREQSVKGRYSYSVDSKEDIKSSHKITGGIVNGTFLFWGALVGYYVKEKTTIAILTWQPGLIAAEIAATDIQIINSGSED